MRGAARARSAARLPLAPPLSRASTSAADSIDIVTEAELKRDAALPMAEGSHVGFAPLKIDWKPRSSSSQKVAVETKGLFCASNDPLEHTHSDVGKFFQLDSSTTAFEKVFYHTGFCGQSTQERQQKLKSSAMMVREPGVKLRDELLALDRKDRLASASGMVVNGDMGVGKSMVLNYVVACMQSAGWLVAVMPHAADWTLGVSAKSAQWPNEAYRIADSNFFSHVPPELEGTDIYDNPDATANFLLSFYLSQRDKLAQIPIKGAERKAAYADVASDPALGPTLADMLGKFVRDDYDGFSDFPFPARPMYDTLAELRSVTEFPTLLVVDGWNRWDQLCTSCVWKTKRPLHAQQLLAPSILGGGSLEYGESMARGAMLCAVNHGGARAPGIPPRQRKYMNPPLDFTDRHGLPDDILKAVRPVKAYSPTEVQRALEFYALAGHAQNAALDAQLRTGELATKVGMLSAGVAEDVYRLCEQM